MALRGTTRPRLAEGRGVTEPAPDATIPEPLEDDELRLIFTCCHPVLLADARIALTLREVSGLTREQIARAYLVRAPTIGRRIVRAKAKIREANIPNETPALRGLFLCQLLKLLDSAYLAGAYRAWKPCRGSLWQSATPELLSHGLSFVAMVLAMIEMLSEVLRARNASTDLVVGAGRFASTSSSAWHGFFYFRSTCCLRVPSSFRRAPPLLLL